MTQRVEEEGESNPCMATLLIAIKRVCEATKLRTLLCIPWADRSLGMRPK
jgi:hypothetical protein